MRPLLVAVALAVPAIATAAAPVTPAQAKALYQKHCEKCHGPDGHAAQLGQGMSFADGEWTEGSDLRAVVEVITDGVQGTGMLPFKDKLTPEEIRALAKYVRTLDKTLKKK
jgi:mono/diheme cytochrome c family protein